MVFNFRWENIRLFANSTLSEFGALEQINQPERGRREYYPLAGLFLKSSQYKKRGKQKILTTFPRISFQFFQLKKIFFWNPICKLRPVCGLRKMS